MATRREFKQAIGERYRTAGRWERRQILDEFTRVTGYHRKHALRVLNRPLVAQLVRKRPRLYGEAVHQALTLLWEAADRICGQRLKPLLPVLIGPTPIRLTVSGLVSSHRLTSADIAFRQCCDTSFAPRSSP